MKRRIIVDTDTDGRPATVGHVQQALDAIRAYPGVTDETRLTRWYDPRWIADRLVYEIPVDIMSVSVDELVRDDSIEARDEIIRRAKLAG